MQVHFFSEFCQNIQYISLNVMSDVKVISMRLNSLWLALMTRHAFSMGMQVRTIKRRNKEGGGEYIKAIPQYSSSRKRLFTSRGRLLLETHRVQSTISDAIFAMVANRTLAPSSRLAVEWWVARGVHRYF